MFLVAACGGDPSGVELGFDFCGFRPGFAITAMGRSSPAVVRRTAHDQASIMFSYGLKV
ncbi:hypothetical protein OROGR_008340 [Orobanche gracilis]